MFAAIVHAIYPIDVGAGRRRVEEVDEFDADTTLTTGLPPTALHMSPHATLLLLVFPKTKKAPL